MEVKTHMPNAKVLSEKQAIVEALAERIKNASAGGNRPEKRKSLEKPEKSP